MKGRALNRNNDIFVERGSLHIVERGAETVQHVRTRLLFYLGEWFLDLHAGTPYFQEIFVKPVNLALVESILKTRILQTPGVIALHEFSLDYTGGDTRMLYVNFTAETTYGETLNEKVTLNGY